MSDWLARDRIRRLPIAPPAPDETVSSVLDRAACLIGTSRDALLSALDFPLTRVDEDLDDADPVLAQAISRALRWEQPWHPPVPVAVPRRLADRARDAFCPECWVEDLATRRGTYYRAAWLDALVPWCARHQTALDSVTSRHLGRRRTVLVASEGASSNQREEAESLRDRVLGRVEGAARETARLACELGRHLPLSDEPVPTWPTAWRGNATLAHVLLRTALCRLSIDSDVPLQTVLWPDSWSGGWGGVFRVGKSISRTPGDEGFVDRFRAIGDPAVRRAALYFVAVALMPEAPLPRFYQMAGHVQAGHSSWWQRVIWPSLSDEQAECLLASLAGGGEAVAGLLPRPMPQDSSPRRRPRCLSLQSIAPVARRVTPMWTAHWRPLLANPGAHR